jgi:hypothetical protein
MRCGGRRDPLFISDGGFVADGGKCRAAKNSAFEKKPPGIAGRSLFDDGWRSGQRT